MAVYELKTSRPAPSNLKGPIKWIINHMLSSPLNIALSVLGILVLYIIIPPFIQWAVIDANFVGSTKAHCTGDGACWIFIIQKFTLFMYGFYPEDGYWRLNTAFILAFVFVLIFKYFGKTYLIKILIFAMYPIIAFNLISGGYFGLEHVPTDQWGGLSLTLIIASVGIVVAFPIGIILAFGRQSELPIIKRLSILYIEFIRGVPLISILFMASVLLPLFFPEGFTFNKLLRALIGITMFQSAYVAEIIRGGLQSIPRGQYEAADSIGLSYWKKMFLVILPQAIKVAIPNLIGASIALFKDTTLVLIIGLYDVLGIIHLAGSDANWLGFDTEGYVFVTFIFWVFCFSLSRYGKFLENKFDTNNR
jgi:general L-amino acid transport system permease protein